MCLVTGAFDSWKGGHGRVLHDGAMTEHNLLFFSQKSDAQIGPKIPYKLLYWVGVIKNPEKSDSQHRLFRIFSGLYA